MNSIKNILGILLVVVLFGCNNEVWKEHYDVKLNTVNANVWDMIQKDSSLSKFVEYVIKYNYDTLFNTDHTYTLFIPNNTAFLQYKDSAEITRAILSYNISQFFILSENIVGYRKIQTLGKKYALFYNSNSGSALDGIPLNFESPLYRNGKYYVMDAIAYPKNNLYEYFAVNNVILKNYIDDMDTLILDKSKSRPLGFDNNGNTIYDTVAIIDNLFEREFFPVKHESRYKTATFVFPKADDYNAALTAMAQTLGGNFHDYRDIPLSWQNKYLVPYLLERGVFENMLEESEFVLNPLKDDTLKLKNILGDSVVIKYTPSEKTLCSNGYAYNYSDFKVPDTLWSSTFRFEGEHLLRNTGVGRWAWKDGVVTSGTTTFAPLQEKIALTSKDSVLRVPFTKNYKGTFTVEFNIDNLFPKKYLMIIRTNYNYGGIFNIYCNDKLLKRYNTTYTIDYVNDNIVTRGYRYASVLDPTKRIIYYNPTGALISFDCWIDNLTEYGKARIKFEYKGPSTSLYNALYIDYIDFKPYW